MSNQQLTPLGTAASSGVGVGPTTATNTAERHDTTGLTRENCETADWLNTATGLSSRIDVRPADVTDLPFADGTFDDLTDTAAPAMRAFFAAP